MAVERPMRLRPRNGEPRNAVEQAAQWLWCRRTALMLVYIMVAVTVGVILDVFGLGRAW